MKRILYCKKLQDWQDRWIHANTGRHSFQYLPTVDTDFICLSPVLTYFITGHGSFPSYLHWIERMPNSFCFCGEIGTPEHYLFDGCNKINDKFVRRSEESLCNWLKRILRNKYAMRKLNKFYNKLNEMYSFITYRF